MMKINIRLFAVGLLLLGCLTVPAAASCFACPPCHSGEWPDCVWDCSSGEVCCKIRVALPILWHWLCCDDDRCCFEKCDPECCEDSDCGPPACWACPHGGCVCDITINSISPDKYYACVGCDVTFTASISGNCDCISWSGGGTPSSQDGGCSFTTKWNSIGNKTVTATAACGESSKQKQVTVVQVDRIKIAADSRWYDVTGDTIVVLKGTVYTFKAHPNPSGASWPDGAPVWSGVASGTGETIVATFDTAGTTSLTAKCGCSDAGKTVTINVVEPIVYQVGFSGDHSMYKTPSANNGWADGTVLITDPVYDSDISKNDPVCVTKNSSSSSLYLTGVKLKVSPGLDYLTAVTIDATGTENWDEGGTRFLGTTSEATWMNIDGNIIDEVKKYNNNFQINWKYKVVCEGTGTYYNINTTNHTVYVTYGSPSGSNRTVQRINFVVNAADGDSNLGTAADDVYDSLKPKSYTFGPNVPRDGPDPIWLIHDGQTTQCPGLAMYVNAHFEMLGLGSGEIRYCWAHANGTCTYDLVGVAHNQKRDFPVSGHSSPTTHDDYSAYEKLRMVDGSGFTNNYEATCYFNGTYYALLGNYDGRFPSPNDVVTSCFNTDWYYWNNSSWQQCSEVPWP